MLFGDRKGMTMVEMIVALALFGVIMGVVFSFLHGSRGSYTEMSDQVEYQQSVRAVLTLISREIRSAGCDPSNAGFDRIVAATATNFRCRMDLDGDGNISITEPAEDVDYRFDAGSRTLLRDSGSGAQTILRDVDDLSFAYFDGDGNALPAPLSLDDRDVLRSVEVTISGETESGDVIDYTTRVLIRNG